MRVRSVGDGTQHLPDSIPSTADPTAGLHPALHGRRRLRQRLHKQRVQPRSVRLRDVAVVLELLALELAAEGGLRHDQDVAGQGADGDPAVVRVGLTQTGRERCRGGAAHRGVVTAGEETDE